MKTIFANIAMLVFIVLAYKFNIFAIMAHKGALIFAVVILAIIFIVAVKVLGNPFNRKEGEHDKDE